VCEVDFTRSKPQGRGPGDPFDVVTMIISAAEVGEKKGVLRGCVGKVHVKMRSFCSCLPGCVDERAWRSVVRGSLR
jgi:hypothetical protein